MRAIVAVCLFACSSSQTSQPTGHDGGKSEDGHGHPSTSFEQSQSVAATPSTGCDAFVEEPNLSNGNRSITFLAFGDTQYAFPSLQGCVAPSKFRSDQNPRIISALNSIPDSNWPEGVGFHRGGEPFQNVRGVLVAGDITENGAMPDPDSPSVDCPEFEAFSQSFGLCGEQQLKYPVYEGYGNHDFPFLSTFDSHNHPVVDAIDARNPYRPAVSHWAPEQRGHYAWVWDDIHFINLNVKPAGQGGTLAHEDIDKGATRKRRVNPHYALGFLDSYLGSDKVPNNSQVLMMSHYGPSNQGRLPSAQREDLCEVLSKHQTLKGVRAIAWIHGHTHKSDFYTWECPQPFEAVSIPVFNVGSPFYSSDENGGDVHFAAFRLGNRKLDAVHVSSPETGELLIPGFSRENDKPLEFNPDGLWGGWAVSLENHLTPPQ